METKKRSSRGNDKGPMGMVGAKVEKPKNFKKTAKQLVQYLRPSWGKLILVGVFAIVSTVFTIAGPKILGKMTDEIIKGLFGQTGINFTNIATIGFWLVGLYIISAIFIYLQNWLMTDVSQKVTYELRRDITHKISRLPLKYFDKHEKGDIVSRVTNDVETVSQNLNQSMTQLVSSIVMILGILVMMISISWKLTLVAIIILPISFGFIGMVVKFSQKHFEKQQKSLGELDGHIEEMFSNHALIKTFNGEDRSVDTFKGINEELYKSGWKAQFLSGLMMPIMHVISNLGYVGVAVVGGWQAINGQISIGDIQAFIQYMNQFTQPISQTANIASVLQSTAAAAERVFEFLAVSEQEPDQENTLTIKNIKGEVEFDNVNFGYDSDRLIIKNLSVHIKPKQNVAIVGPTGAGKTTLVNLLMRFYELNDGAIKIDGVDISKMKRSDVRKMFGMVLQDTWLFQGTIAENIAYGKKGATRDQIIEASKAAHAHHFISALPDGYNTVISESIDSISAGEKQLLTIARAILADSPMLILDEATSSVDTRTELLIQSAMDKLSHGRTSFVIAHRLSTIRNADIILVVKDGNIIEQGNHDELIAKKGYYCDLYSSQFNDV